MEAPSRAVEIKAGITAATTALASLLGWKGVLVLAWCVAMLLDYITGTVAAISAGEWSSEQARRGVWHKSGEIAIVLVAALLDIAVYAIAVGGVLGRDWHVGAVFLPLVSAWCLLTELGSITENAVKMGAPCPPFLQKAISGLKTSISSKSEEKGD